jgi:hypothetical protein
MTPNNEVLNSWKEVATYMGRGVRTVQRWERELGLPVRRPRAKSRSAVIAFKAELDQWLHQAPAEQLRQEHSDDMVPAPAPCNYKQFERQTRLHDNTALLISKTHMLLSRSTDLCEQLNSLRKKVEETVHLTTINIQRNSKTVSRLSPPPEQNTPLNSTTKEVSKQHALAS